jgi:hypothetical protein
MGTEEDLEIAARLAHRRVLRTLEEKVAPAHTALLVVDMQNDFCAAYLRADHEQSGASAKMPSPSKESIA